MKSCILRSVPVYFYTRSLHFHKFRHFSNSSAILRSENFFSPQNRQRIVERLNQNSSASCDIDHRLAIRNGKSVDTGKLKQAAVLVPLVNVNGMAGILFTVRSNVLNSHRGEISFPGGGVDEADGGSAEKAALREAQEEIDVDTNRVEIWGQLPPTLSRPGNTVIRPVIGVIRDDFDTTAFTQRRHGSSEVWAVFSRDLDQLSNRDNLSFTQFRAGYSLPVFYAGNYRIWGLTAIILHNALKILVPDLYRPAIRYARPIV